MTVAKAVESVQVKAKWLKRDQEDVESWLKANSYLDGSKL